MTRKQDDNSEANQSFTLPAIVYMGKFKSSSYGDDISK